ncbi:hypothetical protein FA95DRAFT_1679156 [Auriscalpium vulgare]|uniref:Uncharacterized protein n=1 Tax=Auriscalpium vulgare TaxID=40419 RepID=A0ACB8RUD0_9AGAM|nr:hypothetical protein FA95DRAFT_1679156 [Auriscalpium vulgare]
MSRRLPTELLTLIVGLTPADALYALRSANRTLRALATPGAFRAVRCTGTVKSTAGMLNVLASELREHVEEVHYRDWYATEESDTIDLSPEQEDEELIRINLNSALALLHTLPSLHTLSLTFAPTYDETLHADFEPNDPSASLELQFSTFETLAKLTPAPALRTFVLENLTPFPHPIDADPRFLGIMRDLRELTITTASDLTLEGAIFQDPITAFFTATFPPVLEAPQHTLTSLTLFFDQNIGAVPGLALGRLHYPHLERLALTRVLFDQETGVEAFITAHAATLQCLELMLCKISMPESTAVPLRTWAQIYGAFSERLENLTELEVMDDTEKREEEGAEEYGVLLKRRPIRYVAWDSGWGWGAWFAEEQEFSEDGDGGEGEGEDSGAGSGVFRITLAVQAVAGDEDALDALIKVVRQRAISHTEATY